MDRKRKSDGDDDDRYDETQDVDVGEVADKRKVSAPRRDKWDEDARAMHKSFQIEECRQAIEHMRSCLRSQHDFAEIYSFREP